MVPEVVVGVPQISEPTGGRVRIAADIELPGGPHEVWFDLPAEAAIRGAESDAFVLPALLVAAVIAADRLVVEAPVTRRLAANLEEIALLLPAWFSQLGAVVIEAPHRVEGPARAPGVASFFSGGVDSFFTAVTRSDEIDALVYVDGFDMIRPSEGFRDMVRARIEAAAAGLEKPLLRIESNVRWFIQAHFPWDAGHMTALTALAHALSGGFGTVLATGTRTYESLVSTPSTIHPLVTHLSASERLRVEPVGWGVPRIDRVAAIASSPAAMRHLRVCWENPGEAYNCGRCEKCLRTKVELRLAGVEGSCETLDATIDVKALSRVRPRRTLVPYYSEARVRAEELGDRQMERVMRRILRRTVRSEEIDVGLAAFDSLDLYDAARHGLVATHRDTLYEMLTAQHGRWLVGRVLRDLPSKVWRSTAARIRRLFRRNRS